MPNASDRTVRLSLRPQDESGLLQVDAPQRIAPGQRGEINLSYLIPAGKPRYGTLRDALEVAVDGRSNGTTIVAHGIGVDARPAMRHKRARGPNSRKISLNLAR